MTTAAGEPDDAYAYEWLTTALDEHRDDQDEWQRVGRQFIRRRKALGFPTRRALSVATGLNYKTAGDVETGDRTNFSPDVIIDKIAPAYQVAWWSVAAALDGGQLAPAGTPVPRPAAPAPVTELPHAASDGNALSPAALMKLSPEMAVAALPYVSEVNRELRRWELEYARAHPDVPVDEIPVPPGGDLFGPGTYDASTWDARKAEMPVDDLVSLIAALRALAAPAPGQSELSG